MLDSVAAELRRRVFPSIDPEIGKVQARVTITLKNAKRVAVFVEHLLFGLADDAFRRDPGRNG